MASYYREGKSFTVVYDGRLDGGPKGKRAYIYGLKTEKLARLSKQKKDQEEELLRAGLFTPDAQLTGRRNAEAVPLQKHVQDFENPSSTAEKNHAMRNNKRRTSSGWLTYQEHDNSPGSVRSVSSPLRSN
jgi:hypothetical protein